MAGNLAHAARLVRSIVDDRLAELAEVGVASAPLLDVRHEFREVLYAHPQAAGYDARQFDPLFAATFAQTLAFGLLLAREASEQPVDYEAWRHMPPEHALMRATLRVLNQEEIVRDVGVGFDVMLDTVNSFEATILMRKIGKPDPILYFYEDFLEVFDPDARERYGVYYTPCRGRHLYCRRPRPRPAGQSRRAGLTDEAVTMLDPAAGTGTFLFAIDVDERRARTSSE